MTNLATRTSLTTVSLCCLAVVSLLFSTVANAAAAPRGKPISQAKVIKKQQKSIRRVERRLEKLTKDINDKVALVKSVQQRTGTDAVVRDSQANARLHTLAKRQAGLKRKLLKLKNQNWAQYAISRRINYVPAPPTTAPPPLPPPPAGTFLEVPQPTLAPLRSSWPPGGEKVTVQLGS